ncbi:hypothetical protein RI129_006999 [Pyrocoelia pectoralis]|uniref:GIY-YIG domain-containing protein n=1 Tax=Pyrocoelia pectoralis TaxID=417401 RepID=A0AAN7VFR7_9COLE
MSTKSHEIKVVYNSSNNSNRVSQILPNPKDKFEPQSGKGVCRIPCSCGLVYIGETGRSVSTGISEHERCVRRHRSSKSAVAEHSLQNGHNILIQEAKSLPHSPFFYQRNIREGVEIFKHPNNFNRDEGWSLSPNGIGLNNQV